MKRTKYFDDTVPTEDQFTYTEDSKIDSILSRLRSACQLGIVNGFIITVNSLDRTTIDIGPGEGYTGGKYRQIDHKGEYTAERVSTLSDQPPGSTYTVQGQGLSDYTAGIKNYISLSYVETEDTALGEVHYPFETHNTLVRESFAVVVETESEWNNLQSEDKRNRILVGIVTARGSGANLYSSDIRQVVQPKTHPTPTQPSAITGVSIIGLAQETLIGTGTLRYEASTKKLFWTAPGSTEGSGVFIPSSGNYTLYSHDVIYWITLSVVYAALPLGDEEDSIQVESLYGAVIPRFSAVDSVHRDMIGTGIVSLTNPHGTSINDISGGAFDHADLFHRNGISYDADDGQLECTIDLVNDKIDVQNIGSFNNTFLIDGSSYDTLMGIPAGTPGSVSFDVSPIPGSGDYLIYVDSKGALQSLRLVSAVAPATYSLWSANIVVVDMSNMLAGNGTLAWNAFGNVLSWQAPGDGAPGTAQRVLPGAAPGAPQYYKLYSSDTDNWIIVRITGIMGAVGSTTFTTEKNGSDLSDEVMLKLCVVFWDSNTEQLSDLRDIRSFVTADNKIQVEEEHDAEGRHTKILTQTLRVSETTNPSIVAVANSVVVSASAEDTTAIYGRAADSFGVYGTAFTAYGAYGIAATRGVGGSASVMGVHGSAGNYGVYGIAESNIGLGEVVGVFGSAANAGVPANAVGVLGLVAAVNATGVIGSAALGTGVKGVGGDGVYGTGAAVGVRGSGVTGVYGTSPTVGIKGTGATGVHGIAISKTGVFGSAPTATGVKGSALDYGVCGAVGNNYGVYGYAGARTGVYGEAVVAYGVWGSAPSVGVKGDASNTGVFGEAAVDTGVYGYAVDTGVYGYAEADVGLFGQAETNTGVFGSASASYGVIGQADVEYGVYGSAATYGVYGYADVNYGVYGTCNGNAGKGVFGVCTAAGGLGVEGTGASAGVYGVCTAAGGLGVEGTGASAGVCGLGGDIGGVFEGDTYGVYMINTCRYDITAATVPVGSAWYLAHFIPWMHNDTAGAIAFYTASAVPP